MRGYAPAAPSNLTAALVGTTVLLQWRDNSSDEDGFHIGYSIGADGSATLFQAGGANTTSYQSFHPVPGYTYCFAVRSYKMWGSGYTASPWSPGPGGVCVSAPAPPPPTPPAAPSDVTATLATGADAIFVGWHDNSTNEDGFEVNVTFDGQSSSNTPKVGANPTALTWTDVWAGSSFCFRVRALNYIAGTR
jgi:titin